MAMATCVLTCRNWFCMSRMTCLIIFSGCSALSIRSLRFARTKVETRSSNAMMVHSFFQPLASSYVAFVLFRDLDADSETDADAQREPDRRLMQRLADGGTDPSADECSDDARVMFHCVPLVSCYCALWAPGSFLASAPDLSPGLQYAAPRAGVAPFGLDHDRPRGTVIRLVLRR